MLSMRHAPRTLPRGGREAVHTSGIRPQAAKRTQRIHAHGRHPPFHEKMRKWIAPPSSKNSETVSDTMYHAIPRRTASREIDAVHPLGPTRVHPIHPTRPCTGQCARHGHVDHHTRFDRRPRVSHHTQATAMWGSTNGASVPPTPTPPATARQKRNPLQLKISRSQHTHTRVAPGKNSRPGRFRHQPMHANTRHQEIQIATTPTPTH